VITAALSDSCGVDCDEHGCTVGCDIARENEAPSAIGREAMPLLNPGELAREIARAAHETQRPSARMNASCPP
jgi:hypothetical protein